MTYTIYGMLRSGAFSTEAALAEAGADYTFENISLDKNEQKGAAYLALNPSGKIPALRLPEGAVVTESLAILLIVAERFPEAQLLPPERSAARAQALRWLAFMACEIYPFVEISDYPERFVAAGEQADRIDVAFQAQDGRMYAVPAQIGPRGDVATSFHMPGASHAGFSAHADLSHLAPGRYDVLAVLHRASPSRGCRLGFSVLVPAPP